MTRKYTGKFFPITVRPGTASRGNVSVNTSKSKFKNTKVLASTANNMLKNSVPVKSIVKATDARRDSIRISDAQKIRPVAQSPQKNLSPAVQKTLEEAGRTFFPTEGVKFFTSSAQSGPLFIPITPPAGGFLPVGGQNGSPQQGFIPPPPGSFTPFFTASAQSESTGSTGMVPLAGVYTSGSFNAEEQSIFGLTSLLMLPLNPEMSEKTTGLELRKWEKPRVTAVIAENVRNGYPANNVVIFKKLTSNRANVSKYIIYRKTVFRDREFQKIAELSNEQLTLPQSYVDLVKSLGYNTKDSFVLIDRNISINATYVYKIEVEWTSTNEEPQQGFDPALFLGFGAGSGLLASLFFSGTA